MHTQLDPVLTHPASVPLVLMTHPVQPAIKSRNVIDVWGKWRQWERE